jgi:hypothetical protein
VGDDLVGRAWYELSAPDERLDKDLRAAEGKIRASGKAGADQFEKSWTSSTGRVTSSLTTVRNSLATIGVGLGLATVIGFFGGAIGAASDLNEEATKAQVVFGESATKVEDFAKRADRALGQSQQQAMAAAGGFGNMFRTIGFAEEAAADMSLTMVKLASDMGSFNNQDPSEMLIRLRAGLSGEAEPLRQFGVLLSEARVKAKAYELGIAEVGAELTEAQKVQGRYALILADTALQQGDFARTSTGLANTQRINAAVWANSLAEIGQALLPLAKEMAQWATDVLPAVADSIVTLVRAGEPLLALVLGLSKLWLEHINVILPALVAFMGVKLVASMRTLQGSLVAMRLAWRAMWGAALLGLPVLIEGLEALGGALDDFLDGLGKTDAEIDAFKKLKDLVGDRLIAKRLEEMGVSAEEFARVMEATGGDAEATFRLIHEAAYDTAELLRGPASSAASEWSRAQKLAYAGAADAAEEAERTISSTLGGLAPSMAARVEEAMAKMREVPGGFATTLDNGTTVFGASAEALAQLLPAAIKRADKDAQEAAREIPGNIAKSILEGRDAVVIAADQLADAATDPLVQAAKIAELREQMRDLATVTAEELEKATPATIAADKAKYVQMEIELAGHLLRQDPKSKEAARLLAKYYKSEDPATQAALQSLLDAVGVRLETLELDAEQHAVDTAQALPEALKDARADAVREQIDTNRALAQEAASLANPMRASGVAVGTSFGDGIYGSRTTARTKVGGFAEFATAGIETLSLYNAGNRVGKSWGDGLYSAGNYVRQKADQMARYGTRDLVGLSPPKEGPLREIDKWGFNVGRAWGQGLERGISATAALAALGGAGILAGAVSGGAAAPGQIGAPGAAGGTTIIYQLHVNGQQSSFDSPYGAVDELTRLGVFSDPGIR